MIVLEEEVEDHESIVMDGEAPTQEFIWLKKSFYPGKLRGQG